MLSEHINIQLYIYSCSLTGNLSCWYYSVLETDKIHFFLASQRMQNVNNHRDGPAFHVQDCICWHGRNTSHKNWNKKSQQMGQVESCTGYFNCMAFVRLYPRLLSSQSYFLIFHDFVTKDNSIMQIKQNQSQLLLQLSLTIL